MLSTNQKAHLCVFNICSVAEVKQERVHPKWAKTLISVEVEGFEYKGNDIFWMSQDLSSLCAEWYKDPQIKKQASQIWDAYQGCS